MVSRSQAQGKTPQQSASVPVQNQLRSRPFAPPQTEATPQAEPPDPQTQLENATRLGHSFSRMTARNAPTPPDAPATVFPRFPIQPKLTIGAPGDKYEQEADRVAQQVVHQINAPTSAQAMANETIQRVDDLDDDDGDLQRSPVAETIQRVNDLDDDDDALQRSPVAETIQRVGDLDDDDDDLQMKLIVQRVSTEGAMAASTELEVAIQQSRGSGQPLAESVREPMEQAFGADFTGVRVHADARSDQLNQSIQAKAFTTGQDIFFRQGTHSPSSPGGQELIAHELTHVVQQNGGAVPQAQRNLVSQRLASTSLSLPTNTVQRALGITVNQYKTASDSKGSGPRQRVRAVDRALAAYHQNVPMDVGGYIKPNREMSPGELQATRQLLDNLMVEIDTYLALGNIAEKRQEGTYGLRVAVQDERMKVTQVLARSGGFSTKELDDEVSEAVKTNPANFIGWLETHPEYLKWAGQGAGACTTSAEAMEEMLKAAFDDVRVIGLLAFAASDPSKVANHLVVVVKIAGQDIVIDPTQIQFLGGNPQIAPKAAWRQRLQAVKIAFSGTDYEPAQVIKVKDCASYAAAIAFAGEARRSSVQLADVAREADL